MLACVLLCAVSCERSPIASYERFAAEMADECERASAVLDAVHTEEDAAAARETIVGVSLRLEALAEQVEALDPVEPEGYDDLVRAMKPADEAQLRLHESLSRLTRERSQAARAIFDELEELDDAVRRAMNAAERPTRARQLAEMSERAERFEQRRRAESEADHRAMRGPGPTGRSEFASFEERRSEIIEAHGETSVVTLRIEGLPAEIKLRELVGVSMERLGAGTHVARSGGRQAVLVLAPVDLGITEAAERARLGSLVESDDETRSATIRFDESAQLGVETTGQR